MFLIRDVVPRADQPKIFVVELPYSVTDLSGQPDATAYRRLSAFQEQWLEPACAALGWTFVAWKCEDGSFFLYLYGAGDPNALLEKLAPFDGELGFFNDVDADWSEYAALRELVEQAHSDNEDGEHVHDHVHGDDCDHGDDPHHDHDHHHDHPHHDHAAARGIPVVESDDHDADHGADAAVPPRRNGKSRSIAAGSEAAAATHRPLPRTAPARGGRARPSGSTGLKGRRGSTARLSSNRATARPAAATARAAAATARAAAATAKAAAATAKAAAATAKPTAKPAKRATAKPAKRATAKPAKRAAKPTQRAAAKPAGRRSAARPRRSR
ncbi:MAG TPA: hypothetical protein VHW23_13245 [Kofleriaceae bacterium]|nr:hypothetical protein [Kofleriaceae bacterium]